jgi:hypothetical protein
MLVTIDFDRIDERVRRLTSLPGDESGLVTAPGADGHTLIAFRSAASRAPELSLIDFVDGSSASFAPRRIAPEVVLRCNGPVTAKRFTI